MTAKEYLETNISKDALLGIYGRLALKFDGQGDVEAARLIEGMAAASGHAIRLTGATLGRYRSSVGATDRKVGQKLANEVSSPTASGAKTPAEVSSPDQPELPGVHDGGAARAGWAAERKLTTVVNLLTEIRNLLAGMSGRQVIATGKATAEPEPESRPRPVAVGGAS
jgi:hypothetical protein